MEHDDIQQMKQSVVDVIGGPINACSSKIMYKCEMYDTAGGKDNFWEENHCQTQLAQLVKEYEERPKAFGAYTSP